jgi:putative MATE family efflux protein
MGFTAGAQIIIGRRNGEKNFDKIGGIIDQSFYFILPMAIILTSFLILIMPMILEKIIHSPAIFSASIDYLQVRSFGLIFAFGTFALNAFYIGTTNTKVLILSTILMAAVNTTLDYGLIFGNLGLPKMGIQGAALASVIAEFSSFLFLVIYTTYRIDLNKYQLFKFKPYNKEILVKIFKLASPIMLQGFITLGSWYFFFTLIESLGENDLAISHIIRSIYMVMMIPMFGLSTSANTITSNLIGEGNSNHVLPTTYKIVGISMLLTLPFVVISYLFPTEIIQIYTNDEVIIQGCLKTLKVINVSMFFFCLAFILFNSVTGTGNTKASLLIEFVNIIIYLTSAIIIVKIFSPPIEIVWCSEFIYFGFLAAMSWYYLKYGNWRAKQI